MCLAVLLRRRGVPSANEQARPIKEDGRRRQQPFADEGRCRSAACAQRGPNMAAVAPACTFCFLFHSCGSDS